jgi:hypothetical protein
METGSMMMEGTAIQAVPPRQGEGELEFEP